MGRKFDIGEFAKTLSVSNSDTREQIEYIDIDLIDDDPRNFYELSDLDHLAANIEMFGIQQPLRVRTSPEDPARVVIVSGHRRRAAVRQLVQDGREDLRSLPCIREKEAGSEALQELRLIYGNSATRQLTGPEISRQAERVRELLYQLKEEGHDFPGRMRDYVAEACQVSTSKLARLNVIREGLIPEIAVLWNHGEVSEATAYELARRDQEEQRLLLFASKDLPSQWAAWQISGWMEGVQRIRATPAHEMCGLDHCAHDEERIRLFVSTNEYVCSRTCCKNCSRLIHCEFSCAYASEAKEQKLAEEAEERGNAAAVVKPGVTDRPWVCIRQRAGPLVKEVRYQRPTLRPGDLPSVRRRKNEIVRAIRDSCFRRTPIDRLELMLALMGWYATTYVLTFSDEQLPADFAGVRQFWARFAKDLRRQHGGAFDYVYAIEGLHGDKRWHIHAVLRDEDFSASDVCRWWGGGLVLDPEPLLQTRDDYFRRTAEYFTKERRDGVKLPTGKRLWVASPSLYRKLGPPEKRKVKTGTIRVPKSAGWCCGDRKENAFGAFAYRSWITHP